MSCGYRTHEGSRYWLPMCMGGAVYGKRGCTCQDRKAKADLLERVELLEHAVTELRRLLDFRKQYEGGKSP